MSKKIDLLPRGKVGCCGCGTCALVCPVGAIAMVPKELGCLYPQIDENKCIGCHRCEQACIFASGKRAAGLPLAAYAASAKDSDLLKRSASGGVFAALAEGILADGGAVFGCSLEIVEGEMSPMHICVTDTAQLHKLQGSKYVQSSLGDSFQTVHGLLENGRKVLFSGTPCQVASLKHFLRNCDTSLLYTLDLICHGVPSAELFRGYLKTLEKKGRVTSFSFRDKTCGWGLTAGYTYEKRNGQAVKKLLSPGISSYYSNFLESETYRESCYSCPYAGMERVGDITIGDFWGFEREHPEHLIENDGEFNVQAGISSILVNTEKGKRLLSCYGSELKLTKSLPDAVQRWNGQLQHPSMHTERRTEIICRYDMDGYAGVDKLFSDQQGIRLLLRKQKWKLRTLFMKRHRVSLAAK